MGVSIESELGVLEREITALRVEFERFFAGDLKRAPVQARRKLEETLRRLSNLELEKAAERFRLQTLQSRFSSFSELWDKKLSAREEGREFGRHGITGPISRPLKAPPPPPPQTGGPARGDAPASGAVKARGRIDFTPLFERYCAARKALGEDVSKLKYEKFEDAVRRQSEEIRQRTGATRLVFEVQTTEGRVRLVGRPAPPKG